MQVPDTLAELAVPIDDVHPYEHNPRRGDLGALDRIMRLSERRLALTERLNPKVPPPHCWTGLYRNRGNGTVSTAPWR